MDTLIGLHTVYFGKFSGLQHVNRIINPANANILGKRVAHVREVHLQEALDRLSILNFKYLILLPKSFLALLNRKTTHGSKLPSRILLLLKLLLICSL